MSKIGSLIGGGGSSSSNNEVVEFQKAEAARAQQKEAERRARIEHGLRMIEAIYGDGGKVAGLKVATGSEFDPNKTYYDAAGNVVNWEKYRPAPTTTSTTPGPSGAVAPNLANPFGAATMPNQQTTNPINPMTGQPLYGRTAGSTTDWRADAFNDLLGGGKLYETKAKTYSGIGDDFYDQYRQNVLDYYEPQLADRYSDAQDQLLFRLGRQGILRSSAASDMQGDMVKDYSDQQASIRSKADSLVGNLRNKVSGQKQAAVQQLVATEDPTSTANYALTDVNAIQDNQPELSPLGDIFNTAVQAYTSYQNAKQTKQFADQLATRSPYSTSGAGRVIS